MLGIMHKAIYVHCFVAGRPYVG